MIPGCRDVVVEKNSQNALLMLTKPMNTVGNVVGIKHKKNKLKAEMTAANQPKANANSSESGCGSRCVPRTRSGCCRSCW